MESASINKQITISQKMFSYPVHKNGAGHEGVYTGNTNTNELKWHNSANSSLHLKSCLPYSRCVTLRFSTVWCLSPWLKQLHYLIVLWEIKSYLSLLCLHFLWRGICDLDGIPTLSEQSKRFLRLCYSPGHCHMSQTAAYCRPSVF